ncbi:bifunctional (p)ppGpp synthetase/guanosine-3',5'-bis(diphosphate) 3'-pyrophosphohydrolase [bacterium]|nr:bifunctional (p)ppGpp synthetase/guanosine-3',5'-bis(diphosphate) 3'-pyrophosphohydrolase [bacterium]
MTIERIIKKFKELNPGTNTDILMKAYNFANKAHQKQLRKSGEPYMQHPLHTAYLLVQIKADINTVAAGILHDVPEDTKHTIKEVGKIFGPDIKNLVDGVTKLGNIKYTGEKKYRENLRKMFLAMAKDIRVVFIKFCDRLHNLRTLESLPENKQLRIAKETMEIYAPVAGLLGIWRLKWQLEDLCFKYLEPEKYLEIEQKYEMEKKAERNQYFQKIKNILSPKLIEGKIEKFDIEVRFKHLYSIYQKMQRKERKFDEIYDVFALRVIVPTVDDCYKVLGIIHTIWRPKPKRFKDYIASPKPNGYRSLHTTIFGPEGKNVEFQIRTKEMHDESIYGIAAHWYYKNKKPNEKYKQPEWIKEILEIQKDITDTKDFIKEIKLDIFRNRIFVFSPKGDVFELPEKATPIDFAYTIHTDIGNKVEKALINDKPAKLNQELINGDIVEIVIDKNKKYPEKEWLKSVKTKKAKENIKQYSRKTTLQKIIKHYTK